jgi:hypothetical protein
VGDDHRGFDGKRRVFQAADIQQGENTPDAQQQNSQPDANGLLINWREISITNLVHASRFEPAVAHAVR